MSVFHQILHHICPQSLACHCLTGYGGDFGPCWHHWPQRSSCMYLISLFVCQVSCYLSLLPGIDRMIDPLSLFLSFRDPRVTKEVRERWCVALLWWIFFCLNCKHRILSMETAHHPALFCLQQFSFPIVLCCLLFHSQWHLAAVEFLSGWWMLAACSSRAFKRFVWFSYIVVTQKLTSKMATLV